ncbi:hypothetical protein [Pontibacter sp. G13]|uniref:hypothetical protein n=1 Tax=Pontibacter sp. G13 TaxID=3074898 RepID=UPI00288C451A|nr:hypothetical protein [Pontibacter sp. G13]WNJ20726.1 hypothetical protein RJD25_09610 [Pontibacter sp. G13]
MNLPQHFFDLGYSTVSELWSRQEVRRISAIWENCLAGTSIHADRQLSLKYPDLFQAFQEVGLWDWVASQIGDSYRLVKSLYMDKPDQANWAVNWHQDLYGVVSGTVPKDWRLGKPKDGLCYVQLPDEYLSDQRTLRIHLDECGPSQGGLQVIEGSHANGVLDVPTQKRWIERKFQLVTGAEGSAC